MRTLLLALLVVAPSACGVASYEGKTVPVARPPSAELPTLVRARRDLVITAWSAETRGAADTPASTLVEPPMGTLLGQVEAQEPIRCAFTLAATIGGRTFTSSAHAGESSTV